MKCHPIQGIMCSPNSLSLLNYFSKLPPLSARLGHHPLGCALTPCASRFSTSSPSSGLSPTRQSRCTSTPSYQESLFFPTPSLLHYPRAPPSPPMHCKTLHLITLLCGLARLRIPHLASNPFPQSNILWCHVRHELYDLWHDHRLHLGANGNVTKSSMMSPLAIVSCS